MKEYIYFCRCSGAATFYQVVKYIIKNVKYNIRIVFLCQIVLFFLASYMLVLDQRESIVSVYGIMLAVVSVFSFMRDFATEKIEAFKEYSSFLDDEIRFFDRGYEFLQFILFLERANRFGVLDKESFGKANYFIEVNSAQKRDLNLATNPVFVVFAAFLASSLAILFWETNVTFKALGILITVYSSIFIFHWISIKVIDHNIERRTNKFCAWAYIMPEDEFQEIKRLLTKNSSGHSLRSCR